MAALLEQGDRKGTFRRKSECDIYIYIYIYIFRERGRGRQGERERDGQRATAASNTAFATDPAEEETRGLAQALGESAREKEQEERERACPRMPSLERNLTGNYHRQGNYIAGGFNSCSAVALITEVLGCCSHFLDLGCCSHLR